MSTRTLTGSLKSMGALPCTTLGVYTLAMRHKRIGGTNDTEPLIRGTATPPSEPNPACIAPNCVAILRHGPIFHAYGRACAQSPKPPQNHALKA